MPIATVPITFGPLTGQIPLNDLDANYAAILAYLNSPANRSNVAPDSGALNAYAVNPLPAFTSYTAGQFIVWTPANASTGPSSINISGLGAVSLYKIGGAAIGTNDLLTTVNAVGVTDGTNVQLLNPQTSASAAAATGASMSLIGTAIASNSSGVNFTTVITNAFDEYEIHFNSLQPTTNGAIFQIRISNDNGATYLTSGYSFATWATYGNNASTNVGSSAGGSIPLTAPNGQLITGGPHATASGKISFANPAAADVCMFFFQIGFFESTSGFAANCVGSGANTTVAPVSAVQLSMNTGNILRGNFYLYGIKKA